jgi:hypothetical protein
LPSSVTTGLPATHAPAAQLSVPLQGLVSRHCVLCGTPLTQVLAVVPEHEGTKPSSATPLQFSSTPLQVASLGRGAPGVQLFVTAPPTQLVEPERAHAPMPQVMKTDAYCSSLVPLQLSSMPSHVASLGAGVPGVQLSCTAPPLQLVLPVLAHAPTPQLVDCDT